MQFLYSIVSIALLLCISIVKAEIEVDEAGVLVLTDATFDEAINANPLLLVEVKN